MKRKTNEEYINEASIIHHNKYDYSLVDLTNGINTKVKIICPIHGEFEQNASSHLSGCGCPKCGRKSANEKLSITYDSFIEKASRTHNGFYDYSNIKPDEIQNTRSVIKIVCPIHGEFEQTIMNHLTGRGCPKCGLVKTSQKQRNTLQDFIDKSHMIHGDKYVYSKVNYINAKTPVTIICPIHGEFEQSPDDHANGGSGCPVCAQENRIKLRKSNTLEFIKKAKRIHGEKYDYTFVNYVDSASKVILKCNQCGKTFETKPGNHLSLKRGCPYCAHTISNAEIEIYDFLKQYVPDLQNRVHNILNGELDIYSPSKQIAIEYNGLYWHCELNKSMWYHADKTRRCENLGIRLVHIFEDEWLHKKEIVKSRLLSIFGVTQNRIYARKCTLRIIEDPLEEKTFLDENHIQGYVPSRYCYGLYSEKKLVAVMSFGSSRIIMGRTPSCDEYEMYRFCVIKNCSVVGGASKLLNHFIKIHHPKTIITYADKRWSFGNVYERLGFAFENDSRPAYSYVLGDKRYHRFRFTKAKLVREYGCPANMSEHEFCLKMGWFRIYDCGTRLYRLDLIVV